MLYNLEYINYSLTNRDIQLYLYNNLISLPLFFIYLPILLLLAKGDKIIKENNKNETQKERNSGQYLYYNVVNVSFSFFYPFLSPKL